jgi:hypothetical protein
MKLTFQIAIVLSLFLFIKAQVLAQNTSNQTIPPQPNNNLVQLQNTVPCELNLSQAPVVRGIKFGMTKDEVEKHLGIRFIGNTLSTEDNEIGLSNLGFYRVLVNEYPQQIDGIEAIQLRLFQNKLYSFGLSFERSNNWNNTKQFTSFVSENLNLPKNWTTSGTSLARMNCQGFRVEANTYFLPEVSLTDLTALQEIETKRNEIRNRTQIK